MTFRLQKTISVHNFSKDILKSIRNAKSFSIFVENSFRNQNNALNSDLASTICAIRDIVRELRDFLKIPDDFESSDSDHNGTGVNLVPDMEQPLPPIPTHHGPFRQSAPVILPACSSSVATIESGGTVREGPQAPDGQYEISSRPISPSDDDDTSATDAGAALIAKYAHLDKTGAVALDSEEARRTTVPAVDLLAMMALVDRNNNRLAVSIRGDHHMRLNMRRYDLIQ
jgi:hypothetical protein